ncbi:odorant receptor 94b-like [Bradysia coprophila]|uniref:odorant receptor 94b-like n=1 Tax=Bradysia coprophila TaxID=38358 RepID=UPI00187D9A7C|nr:odorant receptor 94b-like [Bradysia coprophila]XP_037049879.1 odorant receptor 94b-like [Bradysia coprophila]
MYSARIHKFVVQIFSLFRRIGLWHGEDRPTSRQLLQKSFFCIYYLTFILSMSVKAFISDALDESIFLAECSIICAALLIKIRMFLWKQMETVVMLNRICVFTIRNEEAFAFFNNKVEKFVKFMKMCVKNTLFISLGCVVLPFLGSQRSLIANIALPFDWENSEIGFWVVYIFSLTEYYIVVLTMLFSLIMWYLLLLCSLRYKILGMEMKNIGRAAGKVKMPVKEKQAIFKQDLVASIKGHLHLKGTIDDLESFLSKMFLLQFAAGSLCICCSIYCLAFDISSNNTERSIHLYLFLYSTAELFMITYLGNEIMLSSSALSYSLFESDWIGQPHSTQKCIIIFAEYLKRSHAMLTDKLYPLTLETFTRILNSSYSMFNILKNTKQ